MPAPSTTDHTTALHQKRKSLLSYTALNGADIKDWLLDWRLAKKAAGKSTHSNIVLDKWIKTTQVVKLKVRVI